MAVWLAEQVGPAGHVVATDIDTRYLQRLELPNLEALEHNILEDPLELSARVRSIWSARAWRCSISWAGKSRRSGK